MAVRLSAGWSSAGTLPSPLYAPALLWARHPLLKPSGSFVSDGESALLENFANSQQPLAPPHVGGLQPFLRCWIPASLLPPPLVPAGILGAPFLVRVPAVGWGLKIKSLISPSSQ